MRGELSSTSKTTPNLHPKWPIFDVFLLIPRGHIYTNLVKISLLELKILLLVMGLVEDPMALHLDKEIYLLVTIQEVKMVLIILFLALIQL